MVLHNWDGSHRFTIDVDLSKEEHSFCNNFWRKLYDEGIDQTKRKYIFVAIFTMQVSKIRELLADQPISKGTKNRLTRMEKIAIMKRLRDG